LASPDETVAATPTPSQRSIAANLAKAEAEHLQVARLLGEPQVDLAAVVTPQAPTTRQAASPRPSRERLFVYQASADSYTQNQEHSAGRDTHGLIARSISHDELYESVSRLSADADRLTLKF
jgi:hypothetical protein